MTWQVLFVSIPMIYVAIRLQVVYYNRFSFFKNFILTVKLIKIDTLMDRDTTLPLQKS